MNSSPQPLWSVATFYQFVPVSQPDQAQVWVTDLARDLKIQGLMILASEGFNTTCSSLNSENLEQFISQLGAYFQCSIHNVKSSTSQVAPFLKFKAKVRNEICTAGRPDLTPWDNRQTHLSPSEWNQVLKTETDFELVDTRNWYESKLGTFKNAKTPGIEQFTEFSDYLEKTVPKEKKLLIFCTGGIRCEKGILDLKARGFDNVYQLDGGILNYLKEYPHDEFQGECFVFDGRVALDQNLKPTEQYALCPHCGQPGDLKITCRRCDTTTLVCESCNQEPPKTDLCSKNCVYHFALFPNKKGGHQLTKWEALRSSKPQSS